MNKTILTGPLTIPMTNDYLFRALLQQNNKVLKGLISSLLHLPLEEIVSAEITNPIELGKSIDDKTFLLDSKVLLNNNAIINLEMQVINEYNWPDRSLSYLCRSFDNLKPGVGYREVTPVIQIGLLDFTLFPEHPEFYATYQLLNVKNYIKYSDKLCLHVLDLTRTDLATEEDKQYQIDHWGALFKATTWEELRMLAEKNESIAEAIETVYKLSEEEKIRLQCEAREDYYRRQRDAQLLREENERKMRENELKMRENERQMLAQEQQMQKQEQQMQKQEQQMRELKTENKELTEQNRQLIAEIERLRAERAD